MLSKAISMCLGSDVTLTGCVIPARPSEMALSRSGDVAGAFLQICHLYALQIYSQGGGDS